MTETSFNLAIVRGICSSAPECRVLPNESKLYQLQITTRVDGRAMSVPVAILDPAAWVPKLECGDEIVIVGAVRRRFFRAGGTTASRVEIEADTICRGRDLHRNKTIRSRVEKLLLDLDAR